MQEICTRKVPITCVHSISRLETFASLSESQRQLRHLLESPSRTLSSHGMSLAEPKRPEDSIAGQETAGSKKSGKSNKRAPLTHFLAFPLYTPESKPQLEASLARFRDAVTTRPDNQDEKEEQDVDPEKRAKGGTETQALGKEGAERALDHDPDASQATNPLQSNLAAPGNITTGSPPPTASSNRPPLIPPRALRPASTLHFTLGVMSLATPFLLRSAISLLESLSLSLPLPASSPPIIDLTSLSPLPPNAPARCTALYISPSPLSPLQTLGTAIRDRFIDAGLVVAEPKRRELLLHATVMNTIYASDGRRGKGTCQQEGDGKGGGGKNKRGKRVTVDARRLLQPGEGGEEGQGWKDTVWASEVKVGRVGIFEMGAKKVFEERETAEGKKEKVLVREEYKEVYGVDVENIGTAPTAMTDQDARADIKGDFSRERERDE